ncbi:hypothetical protein NE850_00035 [Paraburkholderia sp. USG1]|uniref:hypothetical protein n=1 Tax=Paraburkholderia sp. USG1 TaxID=2952268 RepID=UPI00285D3EFA|nr:hypothetical protein [Paraburkholderia sp. USG1]MDR8394715.1 hypothetical protein [Paraburkholderia sp. USG1]
MNSIDQNSAGERVKDTTDAANVFWSSINSALTLSCIRTFGQHEAATVEYETLRRTHEITLLSLSADAGANSVLNCVRTHLRLEDGSGIQPEWVEDAAGRHWLRYRPPYRTGDGPFAPATAPAALGPEIGQAWFRARHATTALTVGGPTVIFVHTHSLTEGDAWDAGYFVDRGEPVAPGNHYERRTSERIPTFDPARLVAQLPQTRAPASAIGQLLRDAASRMIVLCERLGVVAAAAVIEHAFRVVLVERWQWLPAALGLTPVRTPLAAAQLYAGTARLAGNEVEVEDHGSYALAHHATDHLWDSCANVPVAVREAIIRAWSAALPHHDFDLRASLARPLSRSDLRVAIHFDRGGPGD